ncbi:MAG: response regulator transcription factor [Chromatiales bacterium]|nr:response regulator transcription factor [Chromatiales bacterium]
MSMNAAKAHILLIEDHRDIAEMLYEHLESRGYVLDYAPDGVTGLHLAVTGDYQAIILDLTLPGIDGLSLCERLRSDARKSTPVLMLTARDTLQDKIRGLDTGADDYLVKPFEMAELEARLRAILRRGQPIAQSDTLRVADLSFNTGTLEVSRGTRELQIMPIGLRLLTALMRASPNVVSRDELERQVWGDIMPDSDALRSHLYNLRKAIDRSFDKPLLHTVQGAGYRIADIDGTQ